MGGDGSEEPVESDVVDDTEEELCGGEQLGNDAEDQEGADVAGGGLAASDNTKYAGDDEEDAAVDSLADNQFRELFLHHQDKWESWKKIVFKILHTKHDDDTNLIEDGDGAEDNLNDGENLGCLFRELFLLLVVLPVDADVNWASLGSDSGGRELLVHLCTIDVVCGGGCYRENI